MKTELPVEGYASAHALMEAMQGTNGDTFWLAKAEGHWHGGIHLKDSISGTSGFRSMTDGHIVAYRLNDDYLRAPSGPKMLKFTSTFILIKSTCTPDADKPADALDFYTLWMQLSPLSKYGGDRPALVTASSLKVRQVSTDGSWARGGIPAGHPVNASGENLSLYGAPVDSGGTLPRGAEVEILEEASFFLQRRASPFVFVRVISVPSGKNSSLAVGETGWVSGLGKYLKRQPSTIPGWMQKAKARDVFNQVVTLAGDDLIAVTAGEKIGHAGNHESPGVAPCAFSHLEIFSQDSRFPDFVENKAGLSVGEKLLRSEAGKTLWRYRERENRFVAMEGDSARQTGDRQFTKLTDAKKTEVDGQLWYFIEQENGWLPASDVTEVEQYDLSARGFVMLVQEEPPTDVTKGFQESWLRDVYGKLEVHSTKQNGMYSLSLTEYYQTRLRKWDLDGDQKLSGYEIWRGLHCRESWCRDIVQRLLVKHHSEWLHDADSALWRPRLAELSKRYPAIAQYNHAHINALVWMKEVPEIRSAEALWHMHPLVFLDAISSDDEMDFKWLHVPKGQLTFNSEGNDIENSIYFSRHPHVPNNKGIVIGASGVTFGRGLDLGQQSETYVKNLFIKMEQHTNPLSANLKQWLLGSVGKKGPEALSYCNDIDQYVSKGEQYLTRKQQHYLFNAVYEHQYEVTKRVIANGAEIDNVRFTANIDTLEQDLQDVLVDLTFRGDNSPRTRRYFMKDLTAGRGHFKENISNLYWKENFGVPVERFNSRKGYL